MNQELIFNISLSAWSCHIKRDNVRYGCNVCMFISFYGFTGIQILRSSQLKWPLTTKHKYIHWNDTNRICALCQPLCLTTRSLLWHGVYKEILSPVSRGSGYIIVSFSHRRHPPCHLVHVATGRRSNISKLSPTRTIGRNYLNFMVIFFWACFIMSLII